MNTTAIRDLSTEVGGTELLKIGYEVQKEAIGNTPGRGRVNYSPRSLRTGNLSQSITVRPAPDKRKVTITSGLAYSLRQEYRPGKSYLRRALTDVIARYS